MDELLTDEFLTEFGEMIQKKTQTAINAALAEVEPHKAPEPPKNLYDAVIQLEKFKARESATMEYINTATSEIKTEKELRQIFRDEYDGEDPTNPITFNEWLNGYHVETDVNGNPYKCIYKPIKK